MQIIVDKSAWRVKSPKIAPANGRSVAGRQADRVRPMYASKVGCDPADCSSRQEQSHRTSTEIRRHQGGSLRLGLTHFRGQSGSLSSVCNSIFYSCNLLCIFI